MFCKNDIPCVEARKGNTLIQSQVSDIKQEEAFTYETFSSFDDFPCLPTGC